jgi:hypothetical protein
VRTLLWSSVGLLVVGVALLALGGTAPVGVAFALALAVVATAWLFARQFVGFTPDRIVVQTFVRRRSIPLARVRALELVDARPWLIAPRFVVARGRPVRLDSRWRLAPSGVGLVDGAEQWARAHDVPVRGERRHERWWLQTTLAFVLLAVFRLLAELVIR